MLPLLMAESKDSTSPYHQHVLLTREVSLSRCGRLGGRLCLAGWAGVGKKRRILIKIILIPHRAKHNTVQPLPLPFALGRLPASAPPGQLLPPPVLCFALQTLFAGAGRSEALVRQAISFKIWQKWAHPPSPEHSRSPRFLTSWAVSGREGVKVFMAVPMRFFLVENSLSCSSIQTLPLVL